MPPFGLQSGWEHSCRGWVSWRAGPPAMGSEKMSPWISARRVLWSGEMVISVLVISETVMVWGVWAESAAAPIRRGSTAAVRAKRKGMRSGLLERMVVERVPNC